MKAFKLVLTFFACCFCSMLHAQKVPNAQVWTDFLFDYPFRKTNLFETEFSYQTLIQSSSTIPKWYSFNLTPAYEKTENKYLDILTALAFSYTIQNDTTNSFEIRPMVGVRIYFTPDSRLQTRLTLRYEHRFFKDIGQSGWQSATRLRIRPELVFPLNRSSYFVDKMLYLLTDVEFYISLDEQVKEAFSNRIRNRVGIGYRFTYNFRAEFIYILQRSRNEIDKDYNTRDNIFRIRFKMFFPFKNPILFHNKTEGGGT